MTFSTPYLARTAHQQISIAENFIRILITTMPMLYTMIFCGHFIPYRNSTFTIGT